MKNTQATKKENTIKWLTYHIDEMANNALAQKISEEDTKLNDKIREEILECIEWVKKIKI